MSGGTKLLERAATFVFGQEPAGACIPDNGQVCACYYSYSYCYQTGYKYDVYTNFRYTCTGSCNYTSQVCRMSSVYDPRCP